MSEWPLHETITIVMMGMNTVCIMCALYMVQSNVRQVDHTVRTWLTKKHTTMEQGFTAVLNMLAATTRIRPRVRTSPEPILDSEVSEHNGCSSYR